ncbi:hypothetical protein JCM3770_007142, partial [Rhodotorula araucariae]
VTLYALVTGRLPFQASDPVEMFRQIREDDPAIPTTLSRELQDLLASLLDKSPVKRPPIPELWHDAWLTCAGARPLPSYETNVQREIADPSSDEVDHALAVFRGSTFLAMSAAAKFKGLLTAAAVRRASASTPPTPGPGGGLGEEGGVGAGVMVDSPEMVASSPVSSPVGSPLPSPLPLPSSAAAGGRTAGRAPPRQRRGPQQTTMSSLSIGSAVAVEGSRERAEGERSDDGDDEGADEDRAREEGSPTPMPPSPARSPSRSAVVHGGEAVLSESMAAAGVDRPSDDAGEEERWEEPE